MNYYVFDTEAEAIAAEAIAYSSHIAVHSGNANYTLQTVRWSIPRQRLDGKWVFPVCDDVSGQVWTEEPHDLAWFPAEE